MTLLTQRRQKQAICDAMHGLDPGLDPDTLDDEFYYLWSFVTDYQDAGHNSNELYQDLMRLRLSNEDLKDIIDDILGLEPGMTHQYQSLAEIGPNLPEITFFWQNWLPRGYITTLAAWPGVGKTYLSLDLASRIIQGLPAPDEQKFDNRTGNIIFVDTEDLLPEVWARWLAMGMDGSKFYPVRRPPRQLIDLADPYYQDDLIDMCYDLRPDMVIVDSFSMAHLKGENTIEDVREILLFLDELPREFDCAEFLIHHPRKPPPGLTQPITMHDLRGSGLLLAMSRMILGFDVVRNGPDDDPNGPRRLRVLKTNFSVYPKPLAVHFKPSFRNPEKAELSYSKHDFFTPEASTLTEQCARWLSEVLPQDDYKYQILKKMADEMGFKENVLQDARKLLRGKIVDTIGPQRKGNKWSWSKNGDSPEDGENHVNC